MSLDRLLLPLSVTETLNESVQLTTSSTYIYSAVFRIWIIGLFSNCYLL